MSPSVRNLLVGVTTVAGMAGLIYLALIFGELRFWGAEMYTVTVRLDTAGGLAPESRVLLNGIDIGHVSALRLRDDPSKGVEAICRIRSDHRIPRTAVPHVRTGLLGGGAHLNMRTRAAATGPAENVPADGTAVLHGESGTLTDRFESTIDQMRTDLARQLENFADVANRVGRLADEYAAVGEKLNDMLADRPPSAVDGGERSPNLTTAIHRVDARLGQFKQTLEHINSLLGDETLRSDIRATVHNAHLLSGEMRGAVNSVSERVGQLARRYVGLADDISTTVDEAETLLREARTADGTVGKLVQDPALYHNLEDVAARLGDALQELQLLIEKWKAEGLPVRF